MSDNATAAPAATLPRTHFSRRPTFIRIVMETMIHKLFFGADIKAFAARRKRDDVSRQKYGYRLKGCKVAAGRSRVHRWFMPCGALSGSAG
ncbi:MAG: hypothetical protein QM780_17465 [Hyphomicrobium sp.]|uniref:hypothetical protein n=1 Tax=Hyphomicrobium sp. TaxID=82 RepID=UPI0039E2C048